MAVELAPVLPEWLALLYPYERRMVDVGDGLRMHVALAGDPEGIPVVMVHGNPTWGFLWRRVTDAFLAGSEVPVRVILPDLIGLGLSDKPRDDSIHTLENHGRWLADLLAALEVTECVLAGQDWGGAIGLMGLIQGEVKPLGMVFGNTVIGPPKPGFKATAFHRFARMPLFSTLAFQGLGFTERFMPRVQGDPSSISGDVARAYRWPLRPLRDRVAPLALARMVPNGMDHPTIKGLEQTQAFVEAFDGPAALVWGMKDPILGRLVKRVARALPQASVTKTEAGHFLQEEVPHVLATALHEVVGKLD